MNYVRGFIIIFPSRRMWLIEVFVQNLHLSTRNNTGTRLGVYIVISCATIRFQKFEKKNFPWEAPI